MLGQLLPCCFELIIHWSYHFRVYSLTFQQCRLMNHLIPWSRVLLENFAVSKPIKKLPTFYGTQTFSAMFASALHFPLPLAR